MVPRIRIGAEAACVIAGLVVVSVGWGIDLLGVLSPGSGHDHGSPSSLFSRLNIASLGIGLAIIGVVYEHHSRLLHDPILSLRYFAGYLVLIDGVLHLFALNDHLGHAVNAGFFAAVGLGEIAVGLALPRLPPQHDPAWIALLLFLLAAYIVTRATVVWPNDDVETIEALGLLSKAVEVLAVISLVSLVRRERRGTSPFATPDRT